MAQQTPKSKKCCTPPQPTARVAGTAPPEATMATWTLSFRLPATQAPAPTPKETIHLRPRSFFLEGE
jgi:hypothetical protein